MNVRSGTRRALTIAVAVVLALSQSAAVAFGAVAVGPWPVLGHDSQHTGRSQYNGPSSSPSVLWTRKTSNYWHVFGANSPVVGSGNTIYFSSDDQQLRVYSSAGTQQWQYSLGSMSDWAIDSAPALDSFGRVLLSNPADSKLRAITPTGSLEFAVPDAAGQGSVLPLADGGMIAGNTTAALVVGGPPGPVMGLLCLNGDGTERWRFGTVGNVSGTPAQGSDGTIYAVDETWLYALTPAGGLKWKYDIGFSDDSAASSKGGGSPSIDESRSVVYVAGGRGMLRAVSTAGFEQWKCSTGYIQHSVPAIGKDGTVYVADVNGHLHAIAPSGSLRWTRFPAANQASVAIGANGVVYYSSGDAVNAASPSGKTLWRLALGNSDARSPVIGSDGHLYLTGSYGRLFAVASRPKARLVRSTSWTTLRRNKTYYALGFVQPEHATDDENKVIVRAYRKRTNGTYGYVTSFPAAYAYYSPSKTRYRAAVKFTYVGQWKLVAYHARDSRNEATYGSPDYVTVK